MLQFNTYYHVFNHANGDDNLFREKRNYDFFLKKYHQHIDPIADTIAWCLMPNHFHLLIKIKSEAEIESNFPTPFLKFETPFLKFRTLEKVEKIETAKLKFLSKQFSNFFSSYSQAFNKVYNRRGSLFLKNFKRKEISNNGYLRNLILYIHLNPVKHGFTADFENWENSSFHRFPKDSQQLNEYLFGSIENYLLTHQNRKVYFEEYNKLEEDIIYQLF